MQYRRAKTPEATYFFTLVTYQRQPILNHPTSIEVLRQAFRTIKQNHPLRWRLIRGEFTRRCPAQFRRQCSSARQHRGAVWQRRFWEHQIGDEVDFARHCDYIHYNPVSHGWVSAPRDWLYSSFHRAVRWGLYEEN